MDLFLFTVVTTNAEPADQFIWLQISLSPWFKLNIGKFLLKPAY